MIERPLPVDWEPYTDSPALHQSRAGYIQVLPLIETAKNDDSRGWCTSGWMLAESPETEVICGGINTKLPSHAAIWRQGNLLHFGFEPAPSQMNEIGRALLINSIAYISRFTEDMPLTRTRSVFADDQYPRARASMEEVMNAFTPAELASFFAGSLRIREMTRDGFKQWYAREKPFLHANASGLIDVDPEVKTFGVSFSDPGFIPAAIAALDKGEKKRRVAQALLARYVDGPPEDNGSRDAWSAWYVENEDFLFFSEASGYKWHIDSLAKHRGIPTAQLRGPARATRPLPGYAEK
jgi:hypothetical protein